MASYVRSRRRCNRRPFNRCDAVWVLRWKVFRLKCGYSWFAGGSADEGGCFFDLNRKDMVAADFCDLAVVDACDSLIRSRYSISVQPHSSEISCRSRPPHNSCEVNCRVALSAAAE